MACRQPAEGRKEGRKVWTEGWRKGVPINNTPRRGATVATPITPIDTRISIRARTNTWLAFETSIRSNISKLPRRYIFLSLRKLSAKRRPRAFEEPAETSRSANEFINGSRCVSSALHPLLGDHFDVYRAKTHLDYNAFVAITRSKIHETVDSILDGPSM